MDAIEAGDDELFNECDPETLKEMERRQDEIVEAFLELAMNMKHESRERFLQKHQTETGQTIDEDASDDELPEELQAELKADKK